jgi:hypoxanthine phosphoribosyltransferase
MVEPWQVLEDGIERELISESAIQQRVAELGQTLAAHYQDRTPLLVGVLNGAVIFMADLVRNMPVAVDFEFMAVSSYGMSTETSGVVQILKDLSIDIAGREILIVEDIIDSGLTVQYLRRILEERAPADIKVVTLLRKQKAGACEVQVDFVGFEIPDEFVVGYGLDMAGKFRNLPYVGVAMVR